MRAQVQSFAIRCLGPVAIRLGTITIAVTVLTALSDGCEPGLAIWPTDDTFPGAASASCTADTLVALSRRNWRIVGEISSGTCHGPKGREGHLITTCWLTTTTTTVATPSALRVHRDAALQQRD